MRRFSYSIPIGFLSWLVVTLAFTLNAHALPLPKVGMTRALPKSFTVDYNFEGIAQLDDCSGSLIQFQSAPDTDFAIILTNGHCLESGMPDAGTVVYGQASSRSFGLMNASGDIVADVRATKVIYSTMTKTDITLYQLGKTYAEIKSKYGIQALTLASAPATIGQAVEVISGYWQRGYTCSIDTFVTELKEDQWTWSDSLRYSRPGCEIVPGTSGSPVLQNGTRTVVGINNTLNESGSRCTLDNPCEVDSSGNVSYKKGNGYGQETYWIYSCLNANREIDLAQAGCLLPH